MSVSARLQVTLCSETGEGTVLRAPRVLFKHKSVHIAENFQEQFIYGLSKELRVRQRKLMQSIEASDLQVQSLGSNTGYHMIEVPPGMSVSDVLKALLDHPGDAMLQPFSNVCFLCISTQEHAFSSKYGYASLLQECGCWPLHVCMHTILCAFGSRQVGRLHSGSTSPGLLY